MKTPRPDSRSILSKTRFLVILMVATAAIAFATITAYMQQPSAPKVAKPATTVVMEPEMTFVEGPERAASRPAVERTETVDSAQPRTLGAKRAPGTSAPAVAGICNDVLPALSSIEVEATNVANNAGYATLGAAFAAINAGTHTGTITIDVCGDTAEGTATAVLNASGSGAASYTTIAMSPAGGAARTISGATTAANPLINLNGADNVTIDGLNTGSNSLTISNTTVATTAGTSTIRFIADASNNVVTNCSLLGSSTSTLGTAAGTILFSTGTTTGNDNNTISNNQIGPAGANLPSKAIMASGTSAAIENDLALITGNNIFDFFLPGSSLSGINILTGNEAWTISTNKFYQTATRTFSTTALRYAAITLGNSTGGFTISGNTIGFGAANGTGTTTITGSSNEVRGIDAASVRTTAPATSITGNTISGINQTTSRASATTSASAFIAVAMGTTDGLINATGNTIGSLDGSTTIVINSTSVTASTAPVIGFYNFSFFATDISSNNIGAITIQSTGTTVGFRGILVNTTTGQPATLNSNTIGGAVAGGAITDTQVGSYAMYGIQAALPNVTATGNTIRNMSGASNGAALIISSGLILSGSTGVNTISQNTIHSLSNNSAAAAGNSIYAINCGFPLTANVVERNFIHSNSITGTNTLDQVWGIVMGATGSATFKNNMIRLGLDPAGAAITPAFSIMGMREVAGSTNNFYHNSVYIGGSGVAAGGSNTYAFFSDVVTNVRNFQDNIFWNARSNAVAGGTAQLAIRVGGTAANPPGLTSNYNDLHFSGTDGATGVFNAVVVPNLPAWRAATGQDNNSIAFDPQFIAPNGTAATVDLHIHPTNPTPIEGTGLAIGSVTDDFDGQARAGLTPTDMGADAGNFVALDISPPVITYTPLGNTTSTSNRTLVATITDGTGVAGGALLPRIYFKKSTDGAYVSTQCSLASGTPQNGTYNCLIDYTLVGGGIATIGDTIQYFVVAQDTAGNLGANPGAGFTGTNVNAVTTPPTTPNSYKIANALSGTINVGAAETITSLTNPTGLFETVNNNVLVGNLVINITSDLSGETGSIALNKAGEEGAGAGTYTVTIQPSGAARAITSSAAAVSLIKLNGASRVTINGSIGGAGTDQSLTIENIGTVTPNAVWIGSVGVESVSNNTLKNCIVRNGVNTSSAVVISDAGTAGNPGFFSSITINNNNIQKAFVGVFANGGTTPQNGSNLVYTQNTLNTVGANAIRNVGLYLQGVNGATVSDNVIANFEAATGENDAGIWLNTGTINATVSGNAISLLNYTGTSTFSPIGINVTPGVASSGDVISRNTISNMTSGGSSSGNLIGGITITGASGGVTIERNNVQNIGNSNPATWPAVGINLNGGNNNIVRNNFVSRIFNDQTAGTGAFSPTFGVSGIRLNAGTGHQVYHNSVHMYGAMAGAISTDLLSALAISSLTVQNCDVRNNIFSNEMTGGNATGGSTRFAAITLPTGGTSALNLTLNNNAYLEGTDPNCRMAVVGTTAGSGDFAAANFNPALITPATNFRSYSSTLSVAGTNDDASLASTAAVPFITSSDLHITPSAGPILGGGAAIAITTDYDNDPRPASNPDIGADELVQAVGGVIPAGTFYNASAAGGDSLGGNVTITNALYLNGILNTGANVLIIDCNATVNGAGPASYIDGNLRKNYCATGVKGFEVGTANGYSPVSVNITAGTFPASFTVKAVQGPQPNVNPANSLQRYWTLTEGGDVTANLNFNYLDPTDILGNEANYRLIRVSGGVPFSFPNDCPTPAANKACVDTAGNQATINSVTNFSDWTLGEVAAPTAAPATISGRVTTTSGAPLAGVTMNLAGARGGRTVTDANGNYRFSNIDTDNFYTVTPAMTNYHFSPGSRSYSLLANVTDAVFSGSLDEVITGNVIDTPEYFVRQHYLDFLGREPDQAGLMFWSDQLRGCGNDFNCLERRTINVSAAYFLSIEFQKTGGLVDGLYRASYGRAPLFAEFMPDTARVARDVVVGEPRWEETLTANTQEFLAAWVERAAFRAAYDNLGNDGYVDALISHTGVEFSARERAALVNGLGAGTLSRAQVLQRVVENEGFVKAKFNEAFVRMQYFGYLRRDPDDRGLHFWVQKLNEFEGNFERAEMVKAFLVSGEYRDRFRQ